MTASGELEDVLGAALGEPAILLSRRPGPYASSFWLEELDVEIGGELHRLVFKDVGPHGLSSAARAAKPDFLLDPLREPETYASILAGQVPDAPRLYAAVVEPSRDRFWLFVERVVGTPLHEIGDFERWSDAARWLARLHRECASARAPHLLRYEPSLFRTWLRRAASFHPGEDVTRLERAVPAAAERLAALPQVFLHGEFYASNVLVEESGRVRPVDWEMAAVGPGVSDLAALTAGRWALEPRQELAAAYHHELTGSRPTAAFADALECARLLLAVQWLGWSASWAPPPAHEHDWLGEAARTAERLAL